MTVQEFNEQYQRLADCFPNKFSNLSKLETVQRYVLDMDASWFRSLVDRIVMTPHGDLDIGEAVAGERRSRAMKRFADDATRALQVTKSQMSGDGLEKALKIFGSSSLAEAVEKSQKGKL